LLLLLFLYLEEVKTNKKYKKKVCKQKLRGTAQMRLKKRTEQENRKAWQHAWLNVSNRWRVAYSRIEQHALV